MKIKIIKKLKETSTTGAIQGAPGAFGSSKDIESFNKKEEREQRLKGPRIVEMMSTSGTKGYNAIDRVTADEEFLGQKERMSQQGLRNESIEESPEIEEAKRILDEKGYVAWGIISSGQFGSVFHGETEDGQPLAIKVLWTKAGDTSKKSREVTIDDLNREVRNYRMIGKARGKSEDVAKHFPEVFETFMEDDSSGNPMAFIVMEKLKPLSPDAEQHLPDPSYFAAKKGRGLEVPAHRIRNVSGKSQSIDKRAEMFFLENEKHMSQIKRDLENLVPTDKKDSPTIKGALKNVALGPLQRYASISQTKEADKIIDEKISNIFFKALPAKTSVLDDEEFEPPKLSNSMRLLGRMTKEYRENKFVTLSILHIVEQFMSIAKEVGIDSIDFTLETMLKQLQAAIRQHTLTHSAYKTKQMRNPKDSSGGKGVEAALMKIRPMTGLFPQDLHWGNFLERDDGTIVVVDLGLFKNRGDFRRDANKNNTKTVTENKKITVKILR